MYEVSPSVLESRLLAHHSVVDAAVVGIPDKELPSHQTMPYNTYILLALTAKTKCRKFETNIPRKGISGRRGLSPNFHIHVSVNELYIPTMGLPFLLEEICELILGIYSINRS
jgi:hypothetical protein